MHAEWLDHSSPLHLFSCLSSLICILGEAQRIFLKRMSQDGRVIAPRQTFTKGQFLIWLNCEGLCLDSVLGLASKSLTLRLNRWPTGSFGRDGGVGSPADNLKSEVWCSTGSCSTAFFITKQLLYGNLFKELKPSKVFHNGFHF